MVRVLRERENYEKQLLLLLATFLRTDAVAEIGCLRSEYFERKA
jgi:hypothetical protein